jgi:hypothetical protein
MRSPIAARPLKVDRRDHLPATGFLYVVASLVGNLCHAQALTAERKHFWLKGEFLQSPTFVQRRENLLTRPYHYPLTSM